MGYLKDKNVYLTGAITAVLDDGIGWRDEITERLKEFGLIIKDPCKKALNGEIGVDKVLFRSLAKEHKWQELKETFWPIVRSDLRMVDESNFLIAYIDPEIPIVGTVHEIYVASHLQQKPVLYYMPPETAYKVNPWLLTFTKARWIFTDWGKLFEHLRKIDDNNLDSSRWK